MSTSPGKPDTLDADGPRRKRRLGLTEQIIIGLVLGIAAGVFFGEKASFLKVAGDAFIMLLQITVIPYIIVSLITALGRLSIGDAKSLGLKAGSVLLVLWGVGLAVVLLAPLAFPKWPSASFFSTSQVQEAKPIDFLQLYIPANPFSSMANAVVPAIVVFSVLIGLALTGVSNKSALLAPLSAVADALIGVTGFIAKLAPYGIFALTASAAGTLDLESLSRLQVYVVTYVVLALILSFWLLPALVATVTPLQYGHILRAFRGAVITAFATGNVLIVLPILAEQCKGLIAANDAGKNHREKGEEHSSVDVLVPAAFNFPNLGVILSLIFVLFAGWYIGMAVPVSQYPVISAAGLASLFGGTVLAIPFLFDLLRLPQDLFQVFITVDVLGSRFGTLLAAMHIVTIALVGTFALQNRLRLRLLPLVRFIGITVALLMVAMIGIRAFYTYAFVAPFTKAQALKGLQLLANPQPATVYAEIPPGLGQAGEKPASLAQIRDRGVLRVCATANDYPSAFYNDAKPPQLVGFDIEMAHRFARSQELPIEFLLVKNEANAVELLNNGSCDIFMSSLPITPDRAERYALTDPVYTSNVCLIVRDNRRDEFQTWEAIRQQGITFRLAIPDTPNARSLAGILIPDATIVPYRDQEELEKFLESGAPDVDAIGYLSEEGAAWTLLYPVFSIAVPRPTVFLPVAYEVAAGNDKLVKVFNAWLLDQKSNGTVDQLYRYWMLGEAAEIQKPPRWSVIRNVLHWIN
jgi:Na+/H+-dicarboxylate symporter/ABC-type amino acid transport substrate-binding protein